MQKYIYIFFLSSEDLLYNITMGFTNYQGREQIPTIFFNR